MRLIIGAFAPETSLLEPLSGPGLKIHSVGIGPVDALLGLDALVLEYSPAEVLFLGSAGAYAPHSQIDFAMAAVATFYDPGAKNGQSRMVPAMRQYAPLNPGPMGQAIVEGVQFSPTIVNTTQGISLLSHELTGKELRVSIPGLDKVSVTAGLPDPQATSINQNLHHGAAATEFESMPVLENLELFGLARYCEVHKIPFSSLLAVTNTVGPEGSSEWQKNFERCAEELQQKVIPYLEKWSARF